ncbi:flagellar basal body P-ring formation protein FlgA [Buchnera aphidicola (Macrosiphoniella sanborni)]|uniref:Flagella basal body P-ring formation protein FlgA n=1 Tax=Buchnera aphidicola (Macrosiphoniella sanborni) TaxID=1241865 RepID=A0A4D6YE57_9GAMM|nr:flagellar basal body P-ring formation chaperone FlgA [Buchnera aphidicola]QCI23870.1 flagellar basal body P-ring formation protein FlgA [Buchnera aphidicola (Macrosiphoniella sanborni)]
MKIIIYFILFVMFFSINSVSSATRQIDSSILTHKIYNFFKKEKFFKDFREDSIDILIRTPLKKKIYCEKPILSLVSYIRNSNIVDLMLTCNKKKYYLTVEIQSVGKYIVANKYIPHGTKIQASDLKILTGRLDQLPHHTYRRKKDVIGRVNSRDIFPLQPITTFMIHPVWLVRVNQQVKIIIQGKNFTISSEAKSLNNGSENEMVRVKTNTGKIIQGIVNKKGEVIIFFKKYVFFD